MNIIRRISWRYLLRHPAQMVLAILGVALGVAVVVAIDLANQSSQRAFNLSTETISGKTTDQIIGGINGLPDDLYRQIRLDLGIKNAAPIVESRVGVPNAAGRSFQLLGVDTFVEAPFRPYLGNVGADNNLAGLLTQPRTILLSTQTAQTLAITTGDTLTIRAAGINQDVTILGLISGNDDLSRRALADVLICDIATAQELLNQSGRLSRIDLILPEATRQATLDQLKTLLPADALLTTPQARSQTFSQMTRAFELN